MNDTQKYCYHIAEQLFEKMGRPAGGDLFVREIAKGLERVFDDGDFVLQRNPLANLGLTNISERIIDIDFLEDFAIHIADTIRLRVTKINNNVSLEVICPAGLNVNKQYFNNNSVVACL